MNKTLLTSTNHRADKKISIQSVLLVGVLNQQWKDGII